VARILVVDDNEIVRLGVTARLETLGHEVVAVPKTSHATEELSNDHYDLVICDGQLQRPGDGADFAVQLAQQFSAGGWNTKVMISSSDPKNRRVGIRFHQKCGSEDLGKVIAEVLAE
jgi:CheY-like chemotaxis protein